MNRLVILAAGQGTRLRPLTDDRPKCMVPLAGRPLVEWHATVAREAGVDEVVLVAGHRGDRLSPVADRVVVNPDYATTNMVASLWCAEPLFGDGILVGYGDIVYKREVLEALMGSPHGIAVVVDRRWREYWEERTDDVLSDAESLRVGDDGRIVSIGQKAAHVAEIQGQYIGLIALRGAGLRAARELVAREAGAHKAGKRLLTPKRALPDLYMTDLLQGLVDAGHDVRPVWTDGGWLEIDTLSDLALAERLTTVEDGRLVIHR